MPIIVSEDGSLGGAVRYRIAGSSTITAITVDTNLRRSRSTPINAAPRARVSLVYLAQENFLQCRVQFVPETWSTVLHFSGAKAMVDVAA